MGEVRPTAPIRLVHRRVARLCADHAIENHTCGAKLESVDVYQAQSAAVVQAMPDGVVTVVLDRAPLPGDADCPTALRAWATQIAAEAWRRGAEAGAGVPSAGALDAVVEGVSPLRTPWTVHQWDARAHEQALSDARQLVSDVQREVSIGRGDGLLRLANELGRRLDRLEPLTWVQSRLVQLEILVAHARDYLEHERDRRRDTWRSYFQSAIVALGPVMARFGYHAEHLADAADLADEMAAIDLRRWYADGGRLAPRTEAFLRLAEHVQAFVQRMHASASPARLTLFAPGADPNQLDEGVTFEIDVGRRRFVLSFNEPDRVDAEERPLAQFELVLLGEIGR